MQFKLTESIKILERTPAILDALLSGLSDEWLRNNEGENTWSPYDVVGHLIFGEQTDWLVRTKIILSNSEQKTFEPFDRFAQMNWDRTTPMEELLKEFRALREKNLEELKSLQIRKEELAQKGIHPELGEVSLKQLLASWTVHDLGHIAQISRVMSKQYGSEVGPWKAYLGILHQ